MGYTTRQCGQARPRSSAPSVSRVSSPRQRGQARISSKSGLLSFIPMSFRAGGARGTKCPALKAAVYAGGGTSSSALRRLSPCGKIFCIQRRNDLRREEQREVSMNFVDLHTHSTASDGTETPAQVVRMAYDLGLKGVALTDHDTVAGLDEAEAEAAQCGMPLVRGCELAASTSYGEAHILGLWLPHDLGPLCAVLQDLRRKRGERT